MSSVSSCKVGSCSDVIKMAASSYDWRTSLNDKLWLPTKRQRQHLHLWMVCLHGLPSTTIHKYSSVVVDPNFNFPWAKAKTCQNQPTVKYQAWEATISWHHMTTVSHALGSIFFSRAMKSSAAFVWHRTGAMGDAKRGRLQRSTWSENTWHMFH